MKYFRSTNSKVLSEHIEAIVDKEMQAGKLWRVKFQKSYWFARLYQADSMIAGNGVSLRSGERVRVIAIQGITLLIQPLPEVSKQNQTESQIVKNQLQTIEAPQATNPDSAEESSAVHITPTHSKPLAERGDRTIAFSAGGAFLGGLIAQVPGAIAGALAGAIFGWFEKSKAANPSENPR